MLSDISKPPKEDFWDIFPSNCSISGETSINTVLLRSKLEKVRHKLTNAQKRRGLKAVMSGLISSPDSWFLPIQFRNDDLSMFVNSIVMERQVNFSYLKNTPKIFLLQPFSIILTFSRFHNESFRKHPLQGSGASVSPAYCCGGAQNCIRFPSLAKRVGQINNFYWSFLTVRLLRKYRVYILAKK